MNGQASGSAGVVVTFGEILLRLTAPRREPLLQSATFETSFGGAEANVAVALAHLGTPARLVSVLPRNALAQAAISELRGHGVDIRHVAAADGRLGLYFLMSGAGPRPSEVLYDRADSAFARIDPAAIDWDAALDGANWLHLSGITVAVSASAEQAAQDAVAAAKARGVKVSFDGNFRARLWEARGGNPRSSLDWFLRHADLAFVNHRDWELLSGAAIASDDAELRRRLTADAFLSCFPELTVVASVTRNVSSHDSHELTGGLANRDGNIVSSRTWKLSTIVDRIGGGDSFAAGLIHALCEGMPPVQSIDFAVAVGVLKHLLPGDVFRLGKSDVERLLAGHADVQR